MSSMDLPSLRDLQSTDQRQLLDVVDSLRAQGLSEFTALPQLIVCGDQSSGKSSVLEAISGVPFPRQDNLCTRFATEVILRRAANDGISIGIVPAEGKTKEDQARLLQFGAPLIKREDFPVLFEKAKEAMGLSDSGMTFSKDILRVEIRGPTQPQLTLVDLPGLIHSETRSQTTKDVELVTKLVAKYMAYPRSIILAVVSAKNDVGNQIVLRRAREVDPQGMRTLGIITKPDTLPMDSGSERAFLSLARNEDVKFHLGWHVVRNIDSGATDKKMETRDELETAYFRDSNFKNLPSHSVGIAALRARLSKILFNEIRLELPILAEDIQREAVSNEVQLAKIGPSRATEQERRVFLAELSQSFQIICRDAVRGDYEHAFFQDDKDCEKRLCATIMNMHFDFAEELRINGAKWKITDDAVGEDCKTRREAIEEACMLLKSSRGRELPGLPNPRLVGVLFREYSSPWDGLARQHIEGVWEATNRFLELVLQHLTDIDVSDAILRLWLSPIMDQRLEAAHAKLEELTAVHKDTPMTTNHYFLDNVKKLQQRGNKEDLEERLRKEFSQPDRALTVKDIASIMSTAGPKINPDMDLVAAEDAFDNMQAYYKVAMKLFMDNVPSLAIQAPIVRGIPSMLCPADVYSMTSEIVAKVAGESEEKTAHRAQLLHKRRTLETGSRICKQFAVRPSHCKLPSNTLPMDSQFTKRVGLSAPVESGQSRDRSTMSNRAGKTDHAMEQMKQKSSASPSPQSSFQVSQATANPIIATKPQSSYSPFNFPTNFSTQSPNPPSTFSFSDTTSKPSNAKAPQSWFTTPGTSLSPTPPLGNTGQSLFAGFFTPSPNPGQLKAPSGSISPEPTGRPVFALETPPRATSISGFGSTKSHGPFSTAQSAPTSANKEPGLVAPAFADKGERLMKPRDLAYEEDLAKIRGSVFRDFTYTEQDQCGRYNYQSLGFREPMQRFSFEELRLADYAHGVRYGPG